VRESERWTVHSTRKLAAARDKLKEDVEKERKNVSNFTWVRKGAILCACVIEKEKSTRNDVALRESVKTAEEKYTYSYVAYKFS
jgi:hypothetical protein